MDGLGPVATMDGLSMNWYLFRIKTGFERQVKADVEGLELTAASPMVTKRVRVSRRSRVKVEREFPLLPGYVFVGFPASADLRPVIDLPEVIGPVGLMSFADRVPADQVEAFLSRYDQAPYIPNYKIGDKVRLRSASLEHVVGEVVAMDDETARILVPFLGAQREIAIPTDAAEAA